MLRMLWMDKRPTCDGDLFGQSSSMDEGRGWIGVAVEEGQMDDGSGTG